MNVCLCDHTAGNTDTSFFGHRNVSVAQTLKTGSLGSVHLKCQLYENRDFCLFCTHLSPST